MAGLIQHACFPMTLSLPLLASAFVAFSEKKPRLVHVARAILLASLPFVHAASQNLLLAVVTLIVALGLRAGKEYIPVPLSLMVAALADSEMVAIATLLLLMWFVGYSNRGRIVAYGTLAGALTVLGYRNLGAAMLLAFFPFHKLASRAEAPSQSLIMLALGARIVHGLQVADHWLLALSAITLLACPIISVLEDRVASATGALIPLANATALLSDVVGVGGVGLVAYLSVGAVVSLGSNGSVAESKLGGAEEATVLASALFIYLGLSHIAEMLLEEVSVGDTSPLFVVLTASVALSCVYILISAGRLAGLAEIEGIGRAEMLVLPALSALILFREGAGLRGLIILITGVSVLALVTRLPSAEVWLTGYEPSVATAKGDINQYWKEYLGWVKLPDDFLEKLESLYTIIPLAILLAVGVIAGTVG